ncbi:MAG: hypothetical protein D8M59_06895 [Planctomycetes bacterium]|nr:hypothetical protein [Planctomycetota bacterium]NOG54368.1 hypothetical protein [Planctomycetota bacterium]
MMNRLTHWSAVLCALAFCMIFDSASAQSRQEQVFAGTWRGTSNVAVVDTRSLQFTIEKRNGGHYFVEATALEPGAAEDADEMNECLRGPLSPDGPNRLRKRHVLDQVRIGDQSYDGVVVFTFKLSDNSTRLHLEMALYVEGLETERFSAVGDFQRIGPVPSPEPEPGAFSEFEVKRPTFCDAMKVFAEDEDGTTTTRTLLTGVKYRVRVEGSVNLAPAIRGRWVVADAAYIYYAQRASSYFGRTPARVNVLMINDQPFDPVQEFNTSHIYTMDIEGDGRPLTAVIADSSRDDNEGSLDVRVYRLRPDILQADRPSTIDPALQDVDALLRAGRFQQARRRLRESVPRASDLEKRERIYQLIGVLDFILSRPLDPEELKKGVVMEGTDLIGRAVQHDDEWPSAQNNMAIRSAWNGNIWVNENNALNLLEQAQTLEPGNRVIRTNLANIRAEAAEDPNWIRQ